MNDLELAKQTVATTVTDADGSVWMQVHPVQKFYPAKPGAFPYNPDTIFHALSYQCRYGGHVDHFFSVLQHSVLMCHYFMGNHFDPVISLQSLLHDGGEAFLIDMPRPVKIFFPTYYELETTIEIPMFSAFGLPTKCDPLVKKADNAILYDEGKYLFAEAVDDWYQAWAPGLGFEKEDMRERQFAAVRREAHLLFDRLDGSDRMREAALAAAQS